MLIRRGDKTDYKKIAKFVKDLWMIHVNNEPNFFNKEYVESVDPEKYLESIDNETSFLLIAQENEELAGFMKLDIKEIENFFISKTVMYVDEIYVLDKFRHRGIAKAFMNESEKIAREKGVAVLKARVYQFNHPAQKIMENQGYTQLYSEYFKVLT